ncbi:autotransporter-associated beta strand repeat-containing protein, partial [Limnohabitans sp. 2KL-51]|uniref:autotransporter-associated beta strand repeat-containing protein n=1 Tax=Limnohabitans sp. 2KL-51 TaxID=1977911 RepID=UPI000DD1C0E6
SGATTLNAGTLALGSSNALGGLTLNTGNTNTIGFAGGALQFSINNRSDYSARFSTAASQAYAIDTNGQSVTLATALTSSGGSLTKLGSGTLTLSGANTYSGTTTISSGSLAVSGSLSDTTQVNVASGAVYRVDVDDTVGSIEGAGSITTGAASGTVTLTAGVDGSLSKTFSGVASDGGSAKLALTKSGLGSLTLSGANTYTGTTTVSAGTLVLAGGSAI